MKIVCPCCATGFPIEAGFAEDDAKRLAAITGALEPAVARAAFSYLRLFKPAKQELRVSRAVMLLTELAELINSGRVAKDERTGLYRPCTGAHWIQGMEQMQHQSATRLELPLASHNYLRAIVFGLADVADAKAEQQRDKDAQQRRGGNTLTKADPLSTRLAWARDLHDRGIFDEARYQEEVAAANATYGAGKSP